MEMEVAVMPLAQNMDFNFDNSSCCSSPYMTAPSSPQRFLNNTNTFFNSPTTPSSISPFYRHSSNHHHSSATKVNNHDEDRHNNDDEEEEEEDFEFNFSGQLESTSLSAADELFVGGKIRPLIRPPPPPSSTGYDYYNYESATSTTVSSPEKDLTSPLKVQVQQRGRERVSNSSPRKGGARSLSPIRVSDSDIVDEQEDHHHSQTTRIIITSTRSNNNNSSKSYAASILSAISFSNKKWKLKDLLFRSASEGRATSPDPLRKYAVLSKNKEPLVDHDDVDVKNLSFRSTDSSGSVSQRRRRRSVASAHELHYTANRALSEEMKRKTFLPYKQGLLGCLGFNARGFHDISRGFGSLPRG